jgi:hypothetical protein
MNICNMNAGCRFLILAVLALSLASVSGGTPELLLLTSAATVIEVVEQALRILGMDG